MLDESKRELIDSYLPLLPMRQTRLADQTRTRFEVVEAAEVAEDSAEDLPRRTECQRYSQTLEGRNG